MRWPLSVPPTVSSAPLDRAALSPAPVVLPGAPDLEHCTREELAARVTTCRACAHAARGASTCAACDLRCSHPAAHPEAQLLTRRASTCPASRWSLFA